MMDSSLEPVIRTLGLTKRYKRLTAVDDLNLEVRRGEIFGFLGPNGAGKTTTIALLLGLIRPDAGTAEVLGHDVRRDLPPALRRTGSIVETPAFYPYLSARDNLRIAAQTLGQADEGRIEQLLAFAGLAGRARDKVHTFSTGMNQRLGLAAALLNDPELLILDEPTSGLDPGGMAEVRELISDLARHQGKTVFLSSHLLHEVEQICDRVAIIHHGRLVAQSEVGDLLRQGARLEVRVADLSQAAEVLRAQPWVTDVQTAADRLLVDAPPDAAADVTRVLVEAGLYLSGLRLLERTLESVFLETVGRDAISSYGEPGCG
jgi:ABC-2 type transport system ATP-binding protein